MKDPESTLFEVNGPRSTKHDIESLSREIAYIENMVNDLEEAARVDMVPKVERLKTMEEALIRDTKEVNQTGGADRETTEKLYKQVAKEANSLKIEMEALSQGSPTIVATAADAVFRGVDKLVEKISDKKEEVKEAYREGVESVDDK